MKIKKICIIPLIKMCSCVYRRYHRAVFLYCILLAQFEQTLQKIKPSNWKRARCDLFRTKSEKYTPFRIEIKHGIYVQNNMRVAV